MPSRLPPLRSLGRILLLGLACLTRLSAVEEKTGVVAAEADWPALRRETFSVVWETVNESYYDPTFGGVNWNAVGTKYRDELEQAADKPALRVLLQRMLRELRRTHFAILPREASVFSTQERARMGTVGVTVTFAQDQVIIGQVKTRSAAERAEIKPGSAIVQVDEVEVTTLAARLQQAEMTEERLGLYLTQFIERRLQGPVGGKTKLRVREPDASERNVELQFETYRGEWSDAVGNLPSSHLAVETAVSDDGIGYLHFNIFTRQAMKDIRALFRQLPPAGGLIIDLRGNGGGLMVMASGITGWLSDRTFMMGTMQMRQGHIGFTVTPQTNAFLGPIAVLIDSSSASTSEIMAAGLQEAGRARLFGERTPGAAMPSLFKKLPTGDLLQYAVAEMQTARGALLEGAGVTPDEVVRRTADDLATGRDPVRTAAEAWLQRERIKAPKIATAARD